jgi:hypothetical protein
MEQPQLLSPDVARKEVEKWLDYKKVSQSKREDREDSIERLTDGFMDGTLVLNEDYTITQNLKFPTEGEKPITKLDYKPRLKVSTIHQHLQGVKSDDADGRVCAHIAAITGNPKGVIKALDTEDYNIGQAIAIFFL